MKIGVIADDFTGASDIALTLAEAGLSTAQFIGVPTTDADPAISAGVVALKSRTAPVETAVAESLAACEWLTSQGAEQIVFKVCSTFDSTAQGNIGPVLDALASQLDAKRVFVCPAFPENGRSVYQGHLFVGDTLLNESGMQDHPLTPMKDADLRRVLGQQSVRSIGHVPAITVMQGADAITQACPDSGHIILDAIRDADLMEIGRAASGARLLCGGSGIALGLPANFGATPQVPDWVAARGPGVVLSGSCSRATREQVERYQAIAPSFEITAKAAVSDAIDFSEIMEWAIRQDTPPLIFSSADPAAVQAAQQTFGQDTAAHAIERVFARLASDFRDRKFTRIVVAGGETSGAVVSALGAKVLNIGPRLAAGVPAVRVAGSGSLSLALKSGNFGGPDFFKEALEQMGRNP